VADAQNSGNCTLITNAVVAHVNMDKSSNKANGVTYVDRMTRQVKEVRGKAVILCAQAMESTRILLNSSTTEYPNGLANSSGALGHYLMDHVTGGGAGGELTNMNEKPNANEPDRPNGIYIPRFRNSPSVKKSSGFIRGYGYQGSGGAVFNFGAGGYGATYKQAVKEGNYSIGIGAFGESLARWDNYVEIDKTLKDAWGIPALRISMTHGDNEKALMEDAAAQGAEMLEAAGAKNIKMQSRTEMPGMAIHELGTARMGNDPKKSVLTPFNQTHDVKNLFVMDGASFVSSACQNPTLTMMAITVRGCSHLIERFKTNDV
jgi:choline dehydrogenase-like flavoprotein